MAFYELTIAEKEKKYVELQKEFSLCLKQGESVPIRQYFINSDTHNRKAACIVLSRMFAQGNEDSARVIEILSELSRDENDRVRHTAMGCCGEIALFDFLSVKHIIESGIKDANRYVKKAAAATLKGAVKKNPAAVLEFIRAHLKNKDAEVRWQLLHAMETRAKRRPEDIIPLLNMMQDEKHAKVRQKIARLFGVISLKKAGLENVVTELLKWENKPLAELCFNEVLNQHDRPEEERQRKKIMSVDSCAEYIKSRISPAN